MSWRTPNSYREAGLRRGTATSKFYETRDNLQVRGTFRCPDTPENRHLKTAVNTPGQGPIAEAEREAWLSEIEGLQVSLAGAQSKLDDLDRRSAAGRVVALGVPTMLLPAS